MPIKFSIHQTPKPKDSTSRTIYHARIEPSGTKHLEDICEYINEASSLSPGDIKGALESFFMYISKQLQRGFNVELEGLGHFSVALCSKQVKNEQGKEVTDVEIDGVNFRCSPRLKKAVKKSQLKKVKRVSAPFPDIGKRRERMMEYLETHGTINQRQYASLNGCSRYRAGSDLKIFTDEGIIITSGGTTHKVYISTGV